MAGKRRRVAKPLPPNLFSSLETWKQKTERVEKAGNYATCTVRKWIRGNPCTIAVCHELASEVRRFPMDKSIPRPSREERRASELEKRLAAWFHKAVREEEPSVLYAEFLTGLIDVEWGILAAELLANAWGKGS